MNWYLFIYLWSLAHHPVYRPVYYPPPPIIRPAPVIQPVVVQPTPVATPACEWVSTGAYGSKATCVVPSSPVYVIQPPCLPLAPVCA